MGRQIAFVTCKHYQAFVLPEVPRIIDPLAHTLERLPACDVIDNYGYRRILDVGWDQALKAFLAGSVPQIQDDNLVFNVHLVRHEIDADGCLIVLIKGVIDETMDD